MATVLGMLFNCLGPPWIRNDHLVDSEQNILGNIELLSTLETFLSLVEVHVDPVDRATVVDLACSTSLSRVVKVINGARSRLIFKVAMYPHVATSKGITEPQPPQPCLNSAVKRRVRFPAECRSLGLQPIHNNLDVVCNFDVFTVHVYRTAFANELGSRIRAMSVGKRFANDDVPRNERCCAASLLGVLS